MKIGIMTYWWSNDNYGQILQCYALQKYLRDAGHDAYLIRYDMSNDYVKPATPTTPVWKKILKVFNPIKLFKYVLNYTLNKRLTVATIKEKKKNDKRNFDAFRNKHIKQSEQTYYSYDKLKESPPEADLYIAGSDQIWNPDWYLSMERQAKAYFLDFGKPSVKRISYAASFCKDKIDNEFVKIIVPLLQKFDYISVREKTGLNVCKQCGINDAEFVPDPTMLLDRDIYRNLYKDELLKKTGRPYCFFYFLSNECDFSVKTLYDWAEKRNIDVLYVTANLQIDKYEKTYVSIPEWIYLLEHAEYVITNSYHCSVFSLLFEKKFGIIPLSKNHTDMNDRFNSLFELFKIEKRFINSDFSVLDADINWQLISDAFQKIKRDCKLLDLERRL